MLHIKLRRTVFAGFFLLEGCSLELKTVAAYHQLEITTEPRSAETPPVSPKSSALKSGFEIVAVDAYTITECLNLPCRLMRTPILASFLLFLLPFSESKDVRDIEWLEGGSYINGEIDKNVNEMDISGGLLLRLRPPNSWILPFLELRLPLGRRYSTEVTFETPAGNVTTEVRVLSNWYENPGFQITLGHFINDDWAIEGSYAVGLADNVTFQSDPDNDLRPWARYRSYDLRLSYRLGK